MVLETVPSYDSERVTRVGEQAVVVGASVSGLLAARVLSDGFDQVTVVERNRLPDEPVSNKRMCVLCGGVGKQHQGGGVGAYGGHYHDTRNCFAIQAGSDF